MSINALLLVLVVLLTLILASELWGEYSEICRKSEEAERRFEAQIENLINAPGFDPVTWTVAQRQFPELYIDTEGSDEEDEKKNA